MEKEWLAAAIYGEPGVVRSECLRQLHETTAFHSDIEPFDFAVFVCHTLGDRVATEVDQRQGSVS